MREKIYQVLNRIYGVMMTVAFFGGLLPLAPFLMALIIGGTAGESIAVSLNKQYYPVIIALASTAILVGVVAMYVGGKEGLSVKKVAATDETK